MTWNITDSLWGTIEFHRDVAEDVKKLIETDIFQRLRYISQLGLAQLVFPGATHTRFSHSLGAAFLADKISTRFDLPTEKRREFVLAALLHDVGHSPFGHCFLKALSKVSGSFQMKMEDDEFWSTEIVKILRPDDFEKIIKVLKNRDNSMHKLVSSNIDVDRIDFISRDSMYTGVKYDVDSDHLINSLIYDIHNDKIYLKPSGVNSAESLLFARKKLYESVFNHPIVSGYENILTRLVENLVDKNRHFPVELPEFFNSVRAENSETILKSYINLSEAEMWSFLKKLIVTDNLTEDIRKMVETLVYRKKVDPEPVVSKNLWKNEITSDFEIATMRPDGSINPTGENLSSISELITKSVAS